MTQYTYVDDQRRGYLSYLDATTQRMLIAEPGGTYAIWTLDPANEVPPPDGRWVTAEADAADEPEPGAEPETEPTPEAAPETPDEDAEEATP